MSVDKSQFRKLVDVPQWEHLKPTSIGLGGTATSASAWASAGDATINENIYMVDRTRLSTYNAKTDSWYRLPPFAGGAYGNDILFTSIKYLKNDGIHGRIISATSTTFTTSGLNGKILNNLIIKIVSGKGAGQERKIISIEDPVIHEQGVSSTTPYITDTTKKWKTNQWLGYQVAVKFGEAIVPSTFLNMGNRSSVLYNSSTILFFYDPVTTMKYEPYISGYNTGNGCEYFIESSVFTIDKKWDIIPDISSRYVIYCGALFTNSISKFTAGGTVRNYNYLVFRDLIRNEVEPTTITYNFFNQPQTPNTCEHICPSSTPYFTGSITSATNRVLRFSSNLTSSLDRWVNYEVQIISGSGFGQKRRIIANTTASLEVIPNWNITPGTGSKFSVVNEDKNIYLVGGGIAGMWCFNKDVFYSHPSPFCDYGTNHPLGVRRSGEDSLPFYMDNYNGVRSTNGITSVNSIPTAKGTGYGVGDELTISGGNNGKVYVETIGVGGTVESVSLLRCGDSYSTGTGKATTGGTGTGCTIEIVTIGTIGRVSVRFMHNFRLGDTIIFSGASEAAWNKSYTVLATDSYSTFDIEITATATATNASSVDYGKIVDTTKNWVTNEHVGKLVTFSPISSNRTYTSRIISNTSKVLRLSDANIYPELSSIYIISEPYVFGRDEQYKGYNKTNYGYATSGSKITLIDNTKNWNNNQWANCKFRIEAGTGRNSIIKILGNSSTTLYFSEQSFSPDYTSKYLIYDSFGECTTTMVNSASMQDVNKNWITNQWVGKVLRSTTGDTQGREYRIISNTSNLLRFTTSSFCINSGSSYTILGSNSRASGSAFSASVSLHHNFGTTDFNQKGKYLLSFRGSNTKEFDKYNLTKHTWEPGQFISVLSENLAQGSMYAYDGQDRLYFTSGNTTNCKVYSLNLLTNEVRYAAQFPLVTGTPVCGNRMEIITTKDGLKYLYTMNHSNIQLFRLLLMYDDC